jgi:hypothetical protein
MDAISGMTGLKTFHEALNPEIASIASAGPLTSAVVSLVTNAGAARA